MLTCLIFSLSSQLVKARGNVENLLGLVEESMMVSLNKLTKAAIVDFETKPRHEWFENFDLREEFVRDLMLYY